MSLKPLFITIFLLIPLVSLQGQAEAILKPGIARMNVGNRTASVQKHEALKGPGADAAKGLYRLVYS